eukprot:scpid6144/ scgid23549/ 
MTTSGSASSGSGLLSVTISEPTKWLMPKPFGGTSTEDLQAFFTDFEMCLEANGFVHVPTGNQDTVDTTSRSKMTSMAGIMLNKSLVGSAALMLQSMSAADRKSRAEIEQALNARFGDSGKELLRQVELQARKRKPGESLTELADALQVLVSKAYPDAPAQIANVVAVRSFLDALPPDFARRIGDHEPANLMAATRKAVVLETRDKLQQDTVVVAQASAKPTGDTRLSKLEQLSATQSKLLAKIAERLEKLETSSQRPPVRQARSEVTCFACGELGHFSRFCPNKSSAQKSEKRDSQKSLNE